MYKSTINEELNAVGFLLEKSCKGYWTYYFIIIKAIFIILFYLFYSHGYMV